MKEGVIIRRMIKADIEHISQAFIHQGWPGREDILTSYFQEQENRERDVLVAESDGFVAGYITILPAANTALLWESILNYLILMFLNHLEIEGLGINS